MRFGVLGPLLVQSADGDPVAVPEAKVRALLAALLTDPGRVVSADRLIDFLWGDAPPADPGGAVQTRVSRLRKALAAAGGKDLVEYRARGYALRAAPEMIDAGRFTALTAQARRTTDLRERSAHLTAALNLWRGDAFADFADELFVQPAAARLAELRLAAHEDLAHTRLDLGEHAALAAELGELVGRHPRRERLRSVHMRALYLAGRQSEALDSYHALRRHLGDELGVDPAPELVELYGEILRQTPATHFTDATVAAAEDANRGNVPRALVELIGRDEELAQLRETMRAHRLVTLTGTGGVGKTSLALAAAREPSPEHPDGTWLVELAGQGTTAGPAQLADAVAAVLYLRDDQPGIPDDPVGLLSSALRDKRMRLVLDNCEHVSGAAAALVETLLREVPGLAVLTTSQEPLAAAGERLVTVPPLTASSAAALFTARAENAAPGLVLDDTATVDAICRHLDGIPLALELAANRVRVLGLRELAQRLDDRLGLLTSGRREAPARQQTLRAMLDWSWDLLTASEQIVLRRLAVHADGCALTAAEATCTAYGVERRAVLDLLARLVDRSLVNVSYDDDGPRYRLLESVSVYCAEKRRELGDDAEARAAHAAYYTALAEAADVGLRGHAQDRWRCVLDTEHANLRAAADFAAVQPEAELELRLVNALTWHWFLRGRLAEPKRLLAAALRRDPTAAPEAYARAAVAEAVLRLQSGDTGVLADGARTRLLDRFADIHDPQLRARSQWFLAQTLTNFSDLHLADDLADRAYAGFDDADDDWGRAAVDFTRAYNLFHCSELDAAEAKAEPARARFDRVGDRWGQAQTAALLGRLAETRGDYPRAAAHHREGLRAAEELELWPMTAMILSELGRIALLQGDLDLADEHHRRAQRIAVDHADVPAREYAEIGLALAARRRGDLDTAEAHLRRWHEWNRQLDTELGLTFIAAERGFTAELRGDHEVALGHHTESLHAAQRIGNPRAVALALEGLAGAHSLAGRLDHAARLLGAATAARTALGAPLPPAESGDVDRIRERLRKALSENDFERLTIEGKDLDLFDPAAAIPLCQTQGNHPSANLGGGHE
ncbi:BTAD domain-containing putative transcriptional regulator [Kribbella catacumbae]|uniref:BTAD domain-containing putative transcriptional regulator n=1 Tax=Kribbella catacumbae TaxID=460086 RepID=UPI00036FB251|nr:BTAD domain-containing putative transcriptional regulator [Kribbella catacumbae]